MQTATPRKPPREIRSKLNRRPLDTYLSEIDGTPLLSADEEQELAWRVQEGDAAARDHLVRANLRLVVMIARNYLGKGLDAADLIAEGNLGLLRAAEAFDPAVGTRFSTYAGYWIKQSIRRGLNNAGRTVRLPGYTTTLMARWRQASASLQADLGRPPTPEEVGHSLRLPAKKLKIIKKALLIHYPVVAPTAEDGTPAVESVADPGGGAPGAELMRAEQLRQVMAVLERLGERSRTILRLRFGLDGDSPKTLNEIGAILGLTRERVRQLEREALAGLREHLDAE